MLQADRGSGSSRGLLNLFPSLGYSSILPSVLRNSLLHSESSSSRPSSSDARPSEVGSLSGSSVSTTDAEVSVSRGADHDAVDDIPSTSGREDSDATSDGESAAAAVAAERHRLSSASNIDLQGLSSKLHFATHASESNNCQLSCLRAVSHKMHCRLSRNG